MNSDFKVTHFFFFEGGGGGCLERGAYILIHKINSNCIFFITDNKRECVNPANKWAIKSHSWFTSKYKI